MKPSDELYQLIKTMTKAEKRKFKIDASKESGQSGNIRLFDAIEKQTRILRDYDEEKLKIELKDRNLVKRLYSLKNYLYNLLLNSLTDYHRDKLSILRIDNMIHK